MSSKQPKNRSNKKPIETPLGQAPPVTTEQPDDLSIMKKPINTNIVGIKQLLSLADNATDEVQNYVNYECDILYECRMCRAIFRSLANFILHKRNYCTEKYSRFLSEDCGGFIMDETDTISTDGIDNGGGGIDQDSIKNKALSPVLEKLYKKQEIDELNRTTLNNDLSNDTQNYNQTSNGDDCLILQRIDESDTAVYQTLAADQTTDPSLIKSEVMEIHGIFDNNNTVLGADGKICNYETTKRLIESNIPKQDLICTVCNFKFSTKKTLTSHIKYKHNKTCIVYPCPDCKETFANAWGVYRHLDKVHKRTSAQIKRMRTQILSNAIRKEQEKIKKKNKLSPIKEDEENQWMNNLESDGDFRMCGGCGKKFERRAALQSHSQTCIRRIAVCNTINAKQQQQQTQKQTTTTTTIPKDPIKPQPEILKGAAKRKPKKSKKTPDVAANVKIVDVSEIFKQKQNKINLDTDSMLDILGISKQDFKNESSSSSSSSSNDNNNNNNNNNHEIYISDESCHSSPELNQNEPDAKKPKLTGDIDYLADDSDENFLLKAAPYMKRNELKCISCQTYYASRYQLLWHMSLHFSWYRFQCAKCPFMSFNKYDCSDHAYLKHGTTINLIDSTVLPIPKWKIISMSHDFIKLDLAKIRDRNVPKPLKKQQQQQQQKHVSSEQVVDNRLETIVLDDDVVDEKNVEETRDTRNIETIELLDDEKDPLANENDSGGSGEIVKNETTTNNRPVRTRTRSYKTLQNDFIYDLGKVLKLNDNAIKNSLTKVKKR